MSLLLLFAYPNPLSVPVEELVETGPTPGIGQVFQRPAFEGEWRFVLEIAEPADGESAVWIDVTDWYAGDRYQRGADEYLGKYRASIATVQLQIDDSDLLAPWGQDTTALLGVNVRLDAGLLMRFSLTRIVAATVAEWVPIWMGRVESWGDATESRGQIRTHVVSVVDTIADLANVPTDIINNIVYWPEWLSENLTRANWLFGVDYYGDLESFAYLQDLNLVAAINRMDQGTEPAGLVWRSLRSGRMVVHPAPWDTINVNRYIGPTETAYPDGLRFSYFPDLTDIEYIQDDGQQSFGAPRNVAGVINSLQVTMPGDFGDEIYLIDDPVSAGRYGTRPFQATWISNSPTAADDILVARAYSSSQALPLRTSLDEEGFWSAMTLIDQFDPVTVVHATQDDGLVLTATGVIRNVVEERTYRGEGGLSWQSTVQIDIDATETAPALLPVEDLALVATESPGLGGPSLAEFSWTNPVQPDITPTEVQYRLLGRSIIWQSESYPGVGADGTVIGFLSAATHYTFQVRLIRRVNGVITAYSVYRSISFTTPANVLPVPIPGDDPTDTDVDMPPFDEECEDVSIELQENDGSGWVTVDTFSGAELEQDDAGNWHLVDDIPNSFFNEGSMYRFRGLCDGDVIVTGDPFDPPDDWTDPCTTPPALSIPPYDDASLLVYVPQICAPDIIREAVSGIVGVHGDALAEILALIDDPNQRALLALSDPAWSEAPGGIVAYGECPQVVGVTGDKTVSVRVRVADDSEAVVLWEVAAMRLHTVPVGGGGWRAAVTVYTPGATNTVPSATVLAEDTVYTITATFEYATGSIVLYVDGAEEGTVGGTDNEGTINTLPIWRCGAPPDSWVTDCALWAAAEPPVDPDAPPALANVVHWWDFNYAPSKTVVMGAITVIADRIGSATMTATGNIEEDTTVGTNGLDAAYANPSGGGAVERMSTTGLVISAQPIGVSWVGKITGPSSQGVFFDLKSGTPRPHAYGITNWVMAADTVLSGGAIDLGVSHVFYAEYNGGSSKFYIDGVLVASGAVGAGVPNADGTLFGITGGGVSGDVYIGELAIATGTQTGGAITAEYNRLAAKWGI